MPARWRGTWRATRRGARRGSRGRARRPCAKGSRSARWGRSCPRARSSGHASCSNRRRWPCWSWSCRTTTCAASPVNWACATGPRPSASIACATSFANYWLHEDCAAGSGSCKTRASPRFSPVEDFMRKSGHARSRPLFLKEAQARAQREGIDVKQALDADRERLRGAAYPGPECLEPEEVEQLLRAGAAGELSAAVEARLSHVEDCEDCATLLLACEPGAASLQRLIASVRERAGLSR